MKFGSSSAISHVISTRSPTSEAQELPGFGLASFGSPPTKEPDWGQYWFSASTVEMVQLWPLAG